MRLKHYSIVMIILSITPFLVALNIQINYNGYNQVSLISYIDEQYSVSYTYDSNGNLTNQIITQPNITPLSPSQFSITSNGDLKTLSWEPVTNNVNGTPIIIPLYVIEASSNPTTGFTLIGTTSQTQYTVSSYHYQQRFYRVRAVVNYQRDDVQPAVQIDTVTTETRSNE